MFSPCSYIVSFQTSRFIIFWVLIKIQKMIFQISLLYCSLLSGFSFFLSLFMFALKIYFFCEWRECCSLIGLYVSLSSRNVFLSFFSFWYVNYAPVPGDKFCVSEEKSVVKYPSNVVNVWFVILEQSFSPEKDLNY